MDWKIVVDSCCDVTPELKEKYGISSVPLTINLGDRHFTDDEQLDVAQLAVDIKNHEGKIGSAAPAPMLYQEAFEKAGKAFGVTLSCHLSGSYNSAMAGSEIAKENGAQVHVFDSKSASAGEVLLAIKIGEMLRLGLQKTVIVEVIESFIQQMKTYFVLESLDTLMKNGRIGKLAGKIITTLGIKPIMGSDGHGNIAFFSHARSESQIVDKLTATIKQSGRETRDACMVIAHCNNVGLAEKLKEAIGNKYSFRDIFIVPTRGISTIYANDKGIIMSF